MKGMIHTREAILVISGALGARPVLSCSNMSAGHGARTATANPEHAEHRTAKAQVGDEVPYAVDGMKMRLTADTPSTEYGGKTRYFCSGSERTTFLKNPERYVGH